MKKQIVTTAAAMAVTALMAFQPMTAFAATGNCFTGNSGCQTQVCQSYGCSNQKDKNCNISKGCQVTRCKTRSCSSPKVISYKIGSLGCLK